MVRPLRPFPMALCALLLVALAGCGPDLEGLQTVGVEELASWTADRADLTVCDANNDDVREKLGVLPGAVLLSSYRDYDPATLPAEKGDRVVFYCYNPSCGAATTAARKALAAGFRDVWVMPPGIKGWVAAGNPVDRL